MCRFMGQPVSSIGVTCGTNLTHLFKPVRHWEDLTLKISEDWRSSVEYGRFAKVLCKLTDFERW